jgi:DNA-binding winged helix-turn-helix (wHTH) protein/tetratricopeptide (TPR) repeat protein
MGQKELYRFGELAMDVAERRLSREGQTISLAPKAYDVLVHLVRNAGRLVTKRELLDGIWAGSFVEEGILSVHVSGLRKALGDDNRAPRYIETVAKAGYRFIAPVTSADRLDGQPRRCSIAVLPAQPADGAASEPNRSAGLGIADAVIAGLGRFHGISVRPTRAVHTYTDSAEDPSSIGRSLRVDAVVVTRFDATSDGLRVAAQLVRSRDGARLWSDEFSDRTDTGLPIPEAIAESVAAVFDAPSSPARFAGVFGNWTDLRGALSRRPNRLEVYELVGRGRSHLLAYSMSHVPDSIAAYEAAIGLDGTFAPAQAGLALACCQQAELRLAPHEQSYTRARHAALRALALDDCCADAQLALGAVSFLGQWDWIGAERSFQRALEINPNHTETYVMYGRLLDALGRVDDGLDMKLRALERDPFSPLVHLAISMSYWHQRRYEDMIAWAERTLELDPRHLLAREHIAGAYLLMGQTDRHMAENIRHGETFGAPADVLDALKQIYASEGRAGVVRWVLQTQGSKLPAMQLALLQGEIGDMDAAMENLDRAIDSHEPCLVDLAVGPQWDHLRRDRRFDRCLERMGLGAATSSPAPSARES